MGVCGHGRTKQVGQQCPVHGHCQGPGSRASLALFRVYEAAQHLSNTGRGGLALGHWAKVVSIAARPREELRVALGHV